MRGSVWTLEHSQPLRCSPQPLPCTKSVNGLLYILREPAPCLACSCLGMHKRTFACFYLHALFLGVPNSYENNLFFLLGQSPESTCICAEGEQLSTQF